MVTKRRLDPLEMMILSSGLLCCLDDVVELDEHELVDRKLLLDSLHLWVKNEGSIGVDAVFFDLAVLHHGLVEFKSAPNQVHHFFITVILMPRKLNRTRQQSQIQGLDVKAVQTFVEAVVQPEGIE